MKTLLVIPTHRYAQDYPSFLSLSDVPAGPAYLAASLKAAGHEVVGLNPNNIIGFVDAPTMLKAVLIKALREHKPELIGMGGLCTDYKFFKDAIGIIRAFDPNIKIVLGGNIVSNDPEDVTAILQPDYAVCGDGEEVIVQIANGEHPVKTIIKAKPVDVDTLPLPDYEPFGIQQMMDDYSSATRLLYRFTREYPRPYGIVTARNCPFSCLQGDTLIDTLEGQIAIKDLVGREDVKVLTRNPKTHEPEYANARNIMLIKKNQPLVRVTFGKGGFIDCTHDHKFLTFKNRYSRNCSITEVETEAQDLKVGQSVRAVLYRIHPSFGYIEIEHGRYFRNKQHRLIMEGKLGRKLLRTEHVHHIDHNKLNNAISNLVLTNSHDHTPDYHPETSERMKEHNPMRIPSVKIRQAKTLKASIDSGAVVPFMCTDKGRKVIARIAKVRALSDQNPAKVNMRKRQAEINHKVVSVEKLPLQEDVYCMEVPGYDWFFANGVLVHNCSFCLPHEHKGKYQARSMIKIMEEIKVSYEKYKFNILIILDELFAVNKERMIEFCAGVTAGKKLYGWDFDWMFQTHASAKLDLATLAMAKEAGCVSFSYGLESASPAVLESMHKKINPDDVATAINLAHEAKVGFSANLIFGDIAETHDTFVESVCFWLKHGRDAFVFMGTVIPYPGSELFASAQAKGLFKDKKEYYEHIHQLQPNLTNMNDMEWANHVAWLQQTEGAWNMVRISPIESVERLNETDAYMKSSGGFYFRVTAHCPHCKEKIVYREKLLDVNRPFWLGTGCVSCQRRVKLVKG